MRLVTWNCNMALHRKLEALRSLAPDVAVLCECARPDIVAERAGLASLGADSVWIGTNDHKGLAVLGFNGYRGFLTEVPSVVAGDFNNNLIWDKPGWLMNFSHTLDVLASLGLNSGYHHVTGEAFGEERAPTIYWRDRTKDGPSYHIDYVFAPHLWLRKVRNIEVGCFEDWCGSRLSDHVPLTVDLDLD